MSRTTWTGLSDDRIRKLYKSYGADLGPGVKRRRGKSPSMASYFLKNRDVRRHAAALGGLYALLGLLRPAAAPQQPDGQPDLRCGERFCVTYETYVELNAPHRITFERACALWYALRARGELRPGVCPACGAFMIVDALRGQATECPLCEREKGGGEPG